jgi:hypothetical protein
MSGSEHNRFFTLWRLGWDETLRSGAGAGRAVQRFGGYRSGFVA